MTATIEAMEIDSLRVSQRELLSLLKQEPEGRSVPKKSNVIMFGALNAGLPFGLIEEKKESIGLGVLDVAFVGGGIYAFIHQRATSIPVFIGLIGLRSWSVNEVLSRIRNENNQVHIGDCTKYR